MKLFVVCFGIALAATVVAAIEADKDETAGGLLRDAEVCSPSYKFIEGNKCFYDSNPCDSPPDDFQLYPKYDWRHGYCCGDAGDPNPPAICSKAEPACNITASDCGICVYPKFPPPPKKCCPNSCCEDLRPLADICKSNPRVDVSQWFAYSINDPKDVVISHRIEVCGKKFKKQVAVNNQTTANFTCYPLCCPCCYNLMTTTLIDAKDATYVGMWGGAHVPRPISMDERFSVQGGVQHSLANREIREVFPGDSAYICVNSANNGTNLALFSEILGLIEFVAGINSGNATVTINPHEHRTHLGCSKKTDGGNSGFRNDGNHTHHHYGYM